MNYINLYWNLISNAYIRKISSNIVTERHHIYPKELGGTNNSNNIIKLTLREHFIAHYALHKIYGGSMTLAINMMSNFNKYKNGNNSKRFEKLKRETSILYSLSRRGKKYPPREEKYRIKMSLIKRGLFDYEKDKQEKINKKRVCCDKTKLAVSNRHRGKILSEETKRKISEAKKGFKHSIETRLLMSKIHKGMPSSLKGTHKNKPDSKKGKPNLSQFKRSLVRNKNIFKIIYDKVIISNLKINPKIILSELNIIDNSKNRAKIYYMLKKMNNIKIKIIKDYFEKL